MQVMQPVIQMNKTQVRAEKVLYSMRRNEENAVCKLNNILDEQDALKAELNQLMNN